MAKFIHCVGIQKSGTTLLDSLIKKTGIVQCPFPSEGEQFWGQVPWHTPTAYPAGTLYQYYKGSKGHVLDSHDAIPKIKDDLNRGLARVTSKQAEFIYNKHPTNTVRIPWVKALFPESMIISTVRNPIANVFSIYKRFQKGNNYSENGWWGTKPADWESLIQEDKLIQSAQLWNSVNRKLIEDIDQVSLVVPYHEMCKEPKAWLSMILYKASGNKYDFTSLDLPEIKCFDEEYNSGSRLESKNNYIYKYGQIDIPKDDKIEISGLSDSEIEAVWEICSDTYNELISISEDLYGEAS